MDIYISYNKITRHRNHMQAKIIFGHIGTYSFGTRVTPLFDDDYLNFLIEL